METNDRKIVKFPARPRTITAGPGLELARHVEQQTSAAIRQNERLHQAALAVLIDAMGDATEMTFADGSSYTIERVEREGFTIEPASYPSLTFHKAPK